MDLFATKLRSAIRGVLNESYEARGGYATVVDNLGISPDWSLTIGCEIVIPEEEFEYIANALREFGLLPPKEEEEDLSFDSMKKLYDGYTRPDGRFQPGIFDSGHSGVQLRDHMRRYSVISSELMTGIFDRITEMDFDELVQAWRLKGYSTEGKWEDGTPHHGPGNLASEFCPWCYARFKRIGGGLPTAPGDYIPDEEIKRKLNSGQGGWCCGDPVRPRYFGFQRGRARRGTPEWLQYQYDEVIHIVMREYKKDVLEAVIERLGLESEQYSDLRNLVFGSLDHQGIPENIEFKEPQQRYTKRYLGAPPHMQHREFEAPQGIYLGDKNYRVYYVQVIIHLDPKNSFDQSFKAQKLDAENEDVNPWGGERYSQHERELEDVDEDFISTYHSGFVEHLIRNITSNISNPVKTDYTYTSPAGQEYVVFKVSTGIRGLNFLSDPFMPVKQAELKRRPEYHGKKELPFEKLPNEELLGLHQAEMQGAFGSSDRMILDDLEELLMSSSLGPLKLAPWDPIKPFPIDIYGNIYVIPDDDVLVMPDGKEISGKILEYNETDSSIKIKVNKFSCAKCKKKIERTKKNLEEAKEANNNLAALKYKGLLARLEEKFATSHVEIFQRSEYIDVSKTDFSSEEFIKASSLVTKLGQDMDTYTMWSKPWMLLNLKRLEKAEVVQHPFKTRKSCKKCGGKDPLAPCTCFIKVKGKGGLFDTIFDRLEEKTTGVDQEIVDSYTKKTKRLLLAYFKSYDAQLLDPDRGKVKYGEETVDISGLDWMDKIAIPINASDRSPVIVNSEDPKSIADYERWLTTKRVINTSVYMQIVPHSIIKKHLGIPQEEDLEPIIKAGKGTTIPYVYTHFTLDREEEELTNEAEELANQLDIDEILDEPDEPEAEGELAHVTGGPGGTPYASEKEPEYYSLDPEEEEEKEEDIGSYEDYLSGYDEEDEEDEEEEGGDIGDYEDYLSGYED